MFLKARGASADLFLSIDWSRHPLGNPECWPAALKNTLNILFNSQHPMFIWWGPEHYQFFNDAFAPSFGEGDHSNAMGQKGPGCWADTWHSHIQPQLDQVYRGGTTWHEDQLVPIFRNGKVENAYWTYGYSPIWTDDNTVGGALVISSETTKQVKYAASLKKMRDKTESEYAKLQTLFEQMPFAMSMLEGPEHRYRFANQTCQDLFLKGQPYLGRTVSETLPEAVKQGYVEILDEVYKTGKSRISNESYFELVIDEHTIRPFFINLVNTPFRNSDGEIEGILAASLDVTELVLSRQKIEAAQFATETEKHKFQTLLSNADTAMALTKGIDHIFEYANPAYLSLFDAGRKIVGSPLLEALPELGGQKFSQIMDEVYRTGQSYVEKEARAYLKRTPEGPLEERYFDQTFSRITALDGQPYGVFIHAYEVTDRVIARQLLQKREAQLKAASERAEQASATKSAFLANMSHEIRTPLGAIMGFADLIKDEKLSPECREQYLRIINRNSNQLLRIIDDILDLSKVEAGMMVIEKTEFSLLELLSDFSTFSEHRAREKDIGFKIKVTSALPNIVVSDPIRLRQILVNIVGNAIKFTEKGCVELRVSYEDDFLNFEVTDTGHGITDEQAKNLFQPFSQADISITRKFGGTGLGLVLTRRLSEAMGGHFILKKSEIDVGSTFEARIKVGLSAKTLITKTHGFYNGLSIEGMQQAAKFKDLSILLVEDAPDNQFLISALIEKTGAKLDIVSDGKQGCDLAFKNDYDVILMDIQMPVMDGLTAVGVMRGRGYAKPVIALTAHAMKEERERCLAAGFDAFLSKPIDKEGLFKLLGRYA